MMLYSGAYKEISYDKKSGRYHADEENWEYYRWLVPGTQCVTASRVEEKDLPPDAEKPFSYLFRNHMTPMAADYLVGVQAAELKTLTDKYIDDDGQWRK